MIFNKLDDIITWFHTADKEVFFTVDTISTKNE